MPWAMDVDRPNIMGQVKPSLQSRGGLRASIARERYFYLSRNVTFILTRHSATLPFFTTHLMS
jgi:hypothetical protein